jgi:hypothetical protein
MRASALVDLPISLDGAGERSGLTRKSSTEFGQLV